MKKLESDYGQLAAENNSYKDEVTVLINEKDGLSVTARKKRDNLKKSQVKQYACLESSLPVWPLS